MATEKAKTNRTTIEVPRDVNSFLNRITKKKFHKRNYAAEALLRGTRAMGVSIPGKLEKKYLPAA